ncbi:hypothetical protein [Novosphingobium guangzhouense]|uniref:Uncharacterized protein n=1 Tax=Novosphingobium guangzhouense TaxID=1850347 RepID=A0A2K2G1Y0_9SPHN|nr:hypothetical protein [Novosphingobium guangzhouense]PNU05046.1 hypothetical protein A8V01_04225 [Novosphingobium guangzhouense]
MLPASWPCPLPDGQASKEFALCRDTSRQRRLLIVPALFDEGNKLRRFTVEVMRRLDAAGIDTFLPDLPGCNESVRPLHEQTPAIWIESMAAAARHFGATHVLAIRGGSLFAPRFLPVVHYAPVKGAAILRQMLRARVLASRESGNEENRDTLVEQAMAHGITLAGYPLGAEFFRNFDVLTPAPEADVIDQTEIGGSGLWLRAEPDENPAQAECLATILTRRIRQ